MKAASGAAPATALPRKGAKPAGKADAAARSERDAAELDRYTSTVPGVTAAGSWQDLVGNITVSPSPPRFGAPATVTFDFTEQGVRLQLGPKSFVVAISGSASETSSLQLTFPDPPKPHVWKCRRCQKDFTLDPTPCTPGRAPTLHNWECQVSWKNWRGEDQHCRSGLTLSACGGNFGVHDFKCKNGSCGHKKLSDVVNPSSSGWMDIAGTAACDPGEAPKPHDWACNRCATGFMQSIQNVTCPHAPGSPPEVRGTFTASAQVSVRINDLAERMFLAFSPAELVTWIANLPNLLIAAHEEAIRGVVGRLTAGFPVESPFRASFDHACRNAVEPLQRAFADATRPLFIGLKEAVAMFARRELPALNELFVRIVELLALIGDPRAVLELAAQTLAQAMKLASGASIAKLWKLADQLVGLAMRTVPELAHGITTRLILASKDLFAQHKGQIEVFLEDQLARVAGTSQDVLAFARGVLTAVRDGVDVVEFTSFVVGVTIALVPGTLAALRSDFASVAGSLYGVVASAEDFAADLGQVYGALIDQLKEVQRFTCDEAKLFLSHLGSDALLKKSLIWIRDHWDRFVALIRAGADELRRWIDFMLGLVEQAQHPFHLPEHDRLVGMLEWLQGLPKALLAPDQFGDVGGAIGTLVTTVKGGLLRWAAEGAAQTNTTITQFVKDFVTQTNPILQNLRRVHGAVAPILGQTAAEAKDLTEKTVDDAVKAVHDLQTMEQRVWRTLFAGGGGEGPMVAQINVHGLASDPLQAAGASIQVSEPTAFSDALQTGEQIMGGLATAAAPDASFLSFDFQRQKFRVPHPSVTRPLTFTQGTALPPIPLAVPVPWNAGVALCHLPEFHVIDMRYHYPYGDLGCYHVADLDKDGFVRDWEVRKVRDAVIRQQSEDFYDFNLDCDGDGVITEHDLQLAIEQKQNYINGLMYRRATSPLGFFVALSPTIWGFVTFTDLTDESIPKGIQRRGVMWVADGQMAIPLPPGLMKDGNDYYPLRFHYEHRLAVDKFDSLVPLPDGSAPLLAPLTATTRWDMVLRGGKTGRDFQVYFTAEPMNPMLLTWNIMGTLYLRGVAAGGVGVGAAASVAAGGGAKGATYIHFQYETTAPLIEVVSEWSDRLRHIAESKPSDLPVPWPFIKGILEWTDVPRLSRALIQIAGPLVDLLFDWCDEGHHIRGALGYVRQYVLNKCRPAPSWEELRAEIREWVDVPPAERDLILAAVKDAQGEFGEEDAVYIPWLIARLCHARLKDASDVAKARVKDFFEEKRGRFAASLDQLVAEGDSDKEPYAKSADIRLCGKFEVLNPFIAAFPIRWEDLANNTQPGEATLDQILAVRGNPFYKPIYHTVVEFGSEAKLYTCPNRDNNYFIASCANQKGIVEGSRVLEDQAGNRWLWVRTDAWQHGWVYIDAVVCAELFTLKEAAIVAGKQGAHDATAALLNEVLGAAADMGLKYTTVDEEALDLLNHKAGKLLDKLARKNARPTVVKIEASPPSTVDESRYARVCRAMLARRRAGRRSAADDAIYTVYDSVLHELDMRIHGASGGDAAEMFTVETLDVNEALGERLATSFTKLSMGKREKLWAAATAWLKILHYAPAIVHDLIDALVPPIFEGNLDKAWEKTLEILRKATNVQLEDLLIAVQSCAPAIKEVIVTMIDIGMKLKSIKDAVDGEGFDMAGAGEVGPAGAAGNVTFADLPVKIMRLLIDDAEEPGRPPPAASTGKEQRGLRKDHDHAISFSFEVSAKMVDDEDDGGAAPARKETNERVVALAYPHITRIEYRRVDDDGEESGGDASTSVDLSQDEVEDGLVDEEPADDETSTGDGADGDAEETTDEGIVGQARPNTTIELQITEWGALVMTREGMGKYVDQTRIPKALRDTVGWQVAVLGDDGTPGPWQDIEEKGDHIRFDVTGAHNGKKLRFRASWSVSDWAAFEEKEPETPPGTEEGAPPPAGTTPGSEGTS